MDLNAAMMYIPQDTKQEFGSKLEAFLVSKKADPQKKELELVLMSMMQTLPECVYKPFVQVYYMLR
jgi:hypothetical protein